MKKIGALALGALCALLLAVAARSSMSQPVRDFPAEDSTPVSGAKEGLDAWSAGRRRRCVLSLCDGESLALVGKGAGSALRWWCAQLLARDEVRVTVLDDPPGAPSDERPGDRGGVGREDREEAGDRLGVRLSWGPQAQSDRHRAADNNSATACFFIVIYKILSLG